ncbi:MAG: UDP-glucose 4-epimerase GalE [Candidatus Magasanikbacteria bacterium CG1_02_32_51]|uniref:UDP-glucose 4-epimerase n=1 Tax=Candidatus Magasanikbacteria bacterium CG1_02_32_51 TaxID=1805238 RepID=A0A1J4U7R0_9BACT|nr:MAG: UDP-glucose 4-epimerase GalE [Candidatus Magasanikbacteria bacterium CG1_02_32_51]
MSKYLITGGAGYIGSHVVKQLIEKKNDIVIVDNLSTGFQKTVNTLKKYALTKKVKLGFYKLDLADSKKLETVFAKENVQGVIHFAASIVVSESVRDPLKYYSNNTGNTINLLKACLKYKVNKFIFSSTAAVYGDPDPKTIPLKESGITIPISPYGSSKLFNEKIIQDVAFANTNFKYVILRYFNVAGASVDGMLGQSTKDATHLIKIALETTLGKREKMFINGTDYNTPDGTCIRDYIYVDDLASAHIKSLYYLNKNKGGIFNCGYGKGFSVKDVISMMKKVSGNDFKVETTKRREGDPAIVIADNSKIVNEMDWKPKYDDLKIMCETALAWEKKL